MFSTVRGKECGSTTKSKKDMGVSAEDKRGKKFFSGGKITLAYQSRPVFSSVNQRKEMGIHPVVGWKSIQPHWRTIWYIY